MVDAIAAVLLLAGNAFFVAVEFSLTRVRPSMVDDLLADGTRGSGALKYAVDHIDNYLSACQLGITICTIGLGITAEPPLTHALEDLFGEGDLLGVASTGIAFVIAYAVVSMFHVVLGELAPKSMAIVRTKRTGLLLMPVMRVFYILTRPLVDFFNYLGNLVLRPFGIPPASEAAADPHSESELKALIAESERRGLLDPEELEFAEGVFSFGDHRAREVMIPRTEVISLDAEAGLREATIAAAASGHRRLPLLDGDRDLDDPLGLINLTDLARAVAEETGESLTELARPMLETSDGILLDDLLEDMRDRQRELALVRDEHGTVVGLITLEDVIEQILGDIRGELDPPREMGFERTDGGIRADGDARLDDLRTELDFDPGEIRAATIGGWLIERVGNVPDEGEEVTVDGLRFEVLSRDGARIAGLMISSESGSNAEKAAAGTETAAAGGAAERHEEAAEHGEDGAAAGAKAKRDGVDGAAER